MELCWVGFFVVPSLHYNLCEKSNKWNAIICVFISGWATSPNDICNDERKLKRWRIAVKTNTVRIHPIWNAGTNNGKRKHKMKIMSISKYRTNETYKNNKYNKRTVYTLRMWIRTATSSWNVIQVKNKIEGKVKTMEVPLNVFSMRRKLFGRLKSNWLGATSIAFNIIAIRFTCSINNAQCATHSILNIALTMWHANKYISSASFPIRNISKFKMSRGSQLSNRPNPIILSFDFYANWRWPTTIRVLFVFWEIERTLYSCTQNVHCSEWKLSSGNSAF